MMNFVVVDILFPSIFSHSAFPLSSVTTLVVENGVLSILILRVTVEIIKHVQSRI